MPYKSEPHNVPGPNHNFLADSAATVLERYSAAKGSSKASLEDLRIIGERLNDAKLALVGTKGAFGAWYDKSGFPFDKTWRARLKKLAANWTAIMQAVEALPKSDRRIWSVDSILAVWAKALKASQAFEAGVFDKDDNSEAISPKETISQRLERKLRKAQAHIAHLEALLAQSIKDSGQKKQFETASTIEPATLMRAKKIYSLYIRGSTQDEHKAAQERLQTLADKLELSLEDLLSAYGLAA